MNAGSSPASREQPLLTAERAGIHRLPVPTPFLVGRVNCYLIEDDPLTLIDTGPNSGKSLDELERALAQHGRSVEELGLIVLTHQHMDHLGLVEILARRSGAEVAALDLLSPYLENFSRSASADDEFANEIMRKHGVPTDLLAALSAVGAAFRAFGSSGKVTVPLHDGEELALRDRRLRVLHRPGHSPSDTILWDETRGILFGGDHLLAHISSNPLITRPLREGAPGERPKALIEYIDSMLLTRELPVQIVLAGHGHPILDHVALIDERLRMHQRRAQKVLALLAKDPLTAYEIALEMWGNVALTQAYLTLSEVLGHLDLLLREGQVRELEQRGQARFQAVA